LIPLELTTLFEITIFPGLCFYFALAFFSEWLDRKIVAKLQNRIGPLTTGPWGLLQPFADFVKLLAKEDLTPLAANQRLFTITPLLTFTFSLMPLFLIPILPPAALISFDGDLIFILFVTTMTALTMFLGAWASTNQFSTLGGTRLALQMLGYEIPLTIAALGPAITARTLSLSQIVSAQTAGHWYILTQPLGCIIVVISLLAELHFVPFDIPQAETELVTGWLTEFSGRKLALLKLAKDFELVLASGLLATLFLGGPDGPLLPLGPSSLYPPLWFIVKFVGCLLLFSNLRAVFGRFRIGQVLAGAWKYLTPLAFLQLIFIQLATGVI
jgi:NADH-quinone oxidoreductase subunit H